MHIKDKIIKACDPEYTWVKNPITKNVVDEALLFIDQIPFHIKNPAFCPSEDNEILFEWRDKKNNILLLSIYGDTFFHAYLHTEENIKSYFENYKITSFSQEHNIISFLTKHFSKDCI